MPCNAKLKLHGRAAFNRVLHEYKCVACSIEWPPVSEERVRRSNAYYKREIYQMILAILCDS